MYGGRSLQITVDATSSRASLVEQADTGGHDVTELLATKNPESEPAAAGVPRLVCLWRKRKVPHARKRYAQWTTRIWRDPEIHVGDSNKDFRENRPWAGGEALVAHMVLVALQLLPVVVLEMCDRCFGSVCVIMFDFAQRVHTPSLGMAHYAASSPVAPTAPCRLDCAEGCLHWCRLSLENSELSSASVLKDVKTLTREDPQDLSFFDSHWVVACPFGVFES